MSTWSAALDLSSVGVEYADASALKPITTNLRGRIFELIANPETRLLTNAVEPLFQATDSHAEYLTNWDEVPRKLSAASWTDNQADVILDFGGSATNEPNCAV